MGNPKLKKTLLIAISGFLFLLIVQMVFYFKNKTNDYTFNDDDWGQSGKMFKIPSKLYFAGEIVPLNHVKVREKLYREMLNIITNQQQHMVLFNRADFWFKQVNPILVAQGIPTDFKYVPLIESGFSTKISHRGAAGFWQFIPATAIQYQLSINDEIDERYHCAEATKAACKYIKDAYQTLGNFTLVAASYNMGINGLMNKIKNQKENNYYHLDLNNETSVYVYKLLAFKEVFEHPEKYFKTKQRPTGCNSSMRLVAVDTAISNVTAFASCWETDSLLFYTLNPWIKGSQISQHPNKKYSFYIPANKTDIPCLHLLLTSNTEKPDSTEQQTDTNIDDTLKNPTPSTL